MITTNRPKQHDGRVGGRKGAGEQGERPQLLSTQGDLHKLELEVVLESVGSDVAQFARCDGAGEEEEKQEKVEEEERRGEKRKIIKAKLKLDIVRQMTWTVKKRDILF